jgi:hypothetical protein
MDTNKANTHATLLDILAAGPTDGLPRTETWERNTREGRTCVTLQAGTRRFLNVNSRQIRQSLGDDGKTAVWSVREDTREGRVAPRTAREVEVHGVVEGVHRHDDPLPCTYGRGVAFLVTTNAIRCYLDPGWTELPLEDDVYAGTVNQTESAPAPQTERDEDP